MMCGRAARIGLLIVLAVLGGCQTTGLTGNAAATDSSSHFRVAKDHYTLFYDQEDQLQELIKAGNYPSASILYEEQRAYFDTESAKDADLKAKLQTVADAVNGTPAWADGTAPA